MECLPSVIPSLVGEKTNRPTTETLHDKCCDGNHVAHQWTSEEKHPGCGAGGPGVRKG